MDRYNFQVKFFEAILNKFARRPDGVEAIKKVLNREKDPVYRRINGQAALTAGELALLARHFNISLDAMVHQGSDRISVTIPALARPVQNASDWLDFINASISRVAQLENASGYRATLGPPTYLCCMFPRLLAFRMYIFGVTGWNDRAFKDNLFSFDLLSPEETRKAATFAEGYIALPSKELWNLSFIDNAQFPIEFLLSMDKFRRKEDALLLCDDMSALLQHARKMAELGKKFIPGREKEAHNEQNFDLYYNELPSSDELIYVDSPTNQLVFSTICGPNVMISDDPHFASFIQGWFYRILGQSSSISIYSARMRNQFFNLLEHKLELSRQRIESLINNGGTTFL